MDAINRILIKKSTQMRSCVLFIFVCDELGRYVKYFIRYMYLMCIGYKYITIFETAIKKDILQMGRKRCKCG